MRSIQSKSRGKRYFSFRCSLEKPFFFAWTQVDSDMNSYIHTSANEVPAVGGECGGSHWEPPNLSISLSGYFPVLSLYNSIFLLAQLDSKTHKLAVQLTRSSSHN